MFQVLDRLVEERVAARLEAALSRPLISSVETALSVAETTSEVVELPPETVSAAASESLSLLSQRPLRHTLLNTSKDDVRRVHPPLAVHLATDLTPSRPSTRRPRPSKPALRRAVAKLRASRAGRPRPRRPPPYGRWYLPIDMWSPRASQTELKPPSRAEQGLQRKMANTFIAKQFKQYLEEKRFRLPRALQCLDVDPERQAPVATLSQHLVPALHRLTEDDVKRALRKDFQASAANSSVVPVKLFRHVLSRHGFRFTDHEFAQLIALATTAKHDNTRRLVNHKALKLDFDLFMLQTVLVLRQLHHQRSLTRPGEPAENLRGSSR